MSKVYFYYSAMNAGKSTVLLQSSYNYHERGMLTLLFSPAIDTRAGVGVIKSRIGLEATAHPLPASENIFAHVKAAHTAQPLACVLV
ncbi:MAG: thymidine kinase, partial [Opitutus sp.]